MGSVCVSLRAPLLLPGLLQQLLLYRLPRHRPALPVSEAVFVPATAIRKLQEICQLRTGVQPAVLGYALSAAAVYLLCACQSRPVSEIANPSPKRLEAAKT